MLSLLDILFPDATMNLVKKLSPMNFTQPKLNLSDIKEKYNGWTDWTTWNCALWINNEESIYNIAKDCNDYIDFLFEMQAMCGFYSTPDGADYCEANYDEMNLLIQEIQEPIDW